jgi:predicted RNA binding protein YcfA (HicA-like mRNA interferase family)
MKVREMIRLLEKDGWFLVRTRGSHRQFHHRWKTGLVTVPGNMGDDLHRKTHRSILRQAGLGGDS